MKTASKLQQVRVGRQEVRVSVRPGSGERPPLLLCNGIGASLELLQPFVRRLDPSLEVVSFDVPGVGGSPLPSTPYTFPTLACFVGKMMDELGYDTFDVLGISWGGGLAQQLAFQNPRRVRRAVLVATATGSIMVPAGPKVLAAMITPRRYRDATYAASVAAQLYGGSLRGRPEDAARFLHDGSRVGSQRGYLYQLLAGAGWTSLPGLPFLRQRVLILAGSDDPLIPLANAKIMKRLIPRSTLHVYDDGHLGLVTQAELLGPRVNEFLEAP
ncbi:poly(3-hydroxyalkanoate) depolymerase [Demetria terragena]|uniref:poly(3-hydroxyalkanoate) depolymerase n=1 Tax=Demetria terragena TaxID=63959 RepID=UPI000361C9CB|nr:poly(3-hydroxyalkanoate) depolymerase [Demetria terragena]